MTTGPLRTQYGFSTGLFVSRTESESAFVVGGVGESEEQWAQLMTKRAAQVLWFKLTQLLYPDKALTVTALATTAPLRPPSSGEAVTTHMEVVRGGDGQYTLVGRVDHNTWWVQLTEVEARRLWASLDLALYPVGWEGRESRPKPIN